jgi:truncated hemoglobin YjbI
MTERRRLGDLEPDREMWEALRGGDGLTEILEDFYTRVYADPRLAPFFEGATKARAIEKQYQFLRQIYTGEPVYFGDRPRNAHHWMVISDELFDYREELMATCLRRYGLGEHLVARWRAVEEIFRKQIVKSAPRGKRVGGVELPFDGHDSVELGVGTLCDGCGAAMEQGTTAQYHVRTGRTYCDSCVPAPTLRPPPPGRSEHP